ARGASVLAIELDESLRPVLASVLSAAPSGADNVQVRYADALKIDLGAAAAEALGGAFRAISNLPYYITSELIRALIAGRPTPSRIDVLVQREAAERLAARPGDAGWCELAALVALYGGAQIGLAVPPSAFTPRPHVDSALLHIARHAEPPVAPRDEALLRRVIRAAFAMRRKTMANNLCASFAMPRPAALALLTRVGLPDKVRGEALSLPELSALADAMADDGFSARR
ncbi:MAG: 16S rRNA (adenine(1518)-N(6)/adenine(1519)-N(6))-dimethyltransferase, partial [Clostridiales bacterium]|nr:16S rRNA (adenine(1518)-N(6)/adenine(1519)-N(6))-dimethyltransferase [Clostridiales bacterium]